MNENFVKVGSTYFIYNSEIQLQNYLEQQMKKAGKWKIRVVISNIRDTTINDQPMKEIHLEFYKKEKVKV